MVTRVFYCLKFTRKAVFYSLILSLAAVALTSIPVGGGNLAYDVITCSTSEGADLCSYVHGHGIPWVWLELESLTKNNSGETVSLLIKQLLPLNLAEDIATWFLPLVILISIKSQPANRK